MGRARERSGVIGVLCAHDEGEIAREFFELFKTPWEFVEAEKRYGAVVATRPPEPSAAIRS